MQHSTCIRAPPSNRAVVHIYPDNQLVVSYRFRTGPFVYNRQKQGQYSLVEEKPDKQIVSCVFHKKSDQLLSLYGVGLNEFGVVTTKESTMEEKYKYLLTMHDVENIFLNQNYDDHVDTVYVHLVRSVRVNEPSIDVPFSTFVFTQILGIIITNVINHMSKH